MKKLWLFDLDDTLHDATHASFGHTSEAMTEYIAELLSLPQAEASALRQQDWSRYGATLLGLVRHHHVDAAHFLRETHRLPGLEDRLRASRHDHAALKRLRGRKFVLTNAPQAYAWRVLTALRLADCFDGVIGIEDMTMFGQHRPKPDARMFRHIAARLRVPAARCVLVEDTLEHQRSARRVGMRTVWMRGYLRRTGAQPPATGVHPCRKPAYVCAKIIRLKTLLSLWPSPVFHAP